MEIIEICGESRRYYSSKYAAKRALHTLANKMRGTYSLLWHEGHTGFRYHAYDNQDYMPSGDIFYAKDSHGDWYIRDFAYLLESLK